MLPAILRFPLREHPDFFTQSSVVRTPHFRVYVQKNEKTHDRFAVVVKKKHGKATVRALTRRRMHTLIQEISKSSLRQNDGFYDLAFVIQGAPQEISVYQKELHDFWQSL